MVKELVELFEAAKKAADAAAADGVSSSGPEVSRCTDALKQLRNFPVTYDTLVSTQVGKRLRPLTKHPREQIQNTASELLETWKKIVVDETNRNKKNGSLDNKHSSKTEITKTENNIKVESVHKTSTKKLEKVSNSETIKIEKTSQTDSTSVVSRSLTVKVEKKPSSVGPPKLTSIIKSNDPIRDRIRELLTEALSKVATEADDEIKDEVNSRDPIRVAVSVESTMFEKWGLSTGSQKFKYRSIMFNIKDPNNPDFRRKVLLGDIKTEMIANLTPDEMASDQRKRENKEIKEKALFDCERSGAAKATTDQFRCGRCRQRKCTYYQMQTRSADEPMTTYVTCVNCNNHWKFC